MKLLLLDERFPAELLTGFEVVREPQDDVVAVLTKPIRPVGEELLDRLPALRVVGTASVGFDHIDIEAADARGVAVVSVPDYCTQEVADHARAPLCAAAGSSRSIATSRAAAGIRRRRGRWERSPSCVSGSWGSDGSAVPSPGG
jgi:lactate dehydrogenase-like 2-hydroxyacid dehydrogenase